MKKRIRRKKRGPVVAKKVTYDGIKFASGLEKYMYIALKKAKIKAKYEGETYTIQEGFEFKNRGNKKILPIKYTPDFVSRSFIIECKGRANESFPMRWKLFKKYVKANMPRVTLYKPQNQKECDTVIELITKSKIK
jgi:hypothetical protein